MSYFNQCEHCGASLDPGEKCDCISSALNVTDEEINKRGSLNEDRNNGNRDKYHQDTY